MTYLFAAGAKWREVAVEMLMDHETRKNVASQYANVCPTTMANLLDLSPKCAEFGVLDFWIFSFTSRGS